MSVKEIEELKIEKGVPITPKTRKGSKWDAKIDAMGVGDSIVVQDESDYESFRAALRRKGFRVARERNNHGYRVWKLGDGK